MHTCSACGTENRAGRRFCAQCGAALSVNCSNCGGVNQPTDRFCGDCGAALDAVAVSTAPDGGRIQTAASGAERRLVSVLFADLVGFTALSEHRDPEEVRELLSRYFDRCRSLIERYGGTVEKFIGDAVMAVWGTPVAREDDAERAVRAALALTSAVALLGEEVGMPELRVRAGVLTGNAAVDVGAEGEGMVLGDTVNTASRLQSIAAPGTVLVDDVTRRASEAAIAYEDAGEHTVKGREQPLHAWTALRVVAGAGGARRGAGLEAPFVGRERRAAADHRRRRGERASDGRARLVAVVGEAGSGQVEAAVGVLQVPRRDRARACTGTRAAASPTARVSPTGRSPRWSARGPGSPRRRPPDRARRKLATPWRRSSPTSASAVSSSRGWRTCCGSRSAPDADRADLFSGWRLFFERMSESARWCSRSRISNGRTRDCSSSLTTCSSGPPNTRSSCSHWDARSSGSDRPHGSR